MSNVINKLFNPKKTKLFWMYFVVSAILLVIGILFMPVWENTDVPWKNWGKSFVDLCIAAVILVYLFGYLIRQIKRGGAGVVVVLTIIEFIVMLLIAVGCICMAIPQIRTKIGINENDACVIVGIALWSRGSVELFRSYYRKSGYPIWLVAVNILLVTLGTIMIHRPFFNNTVVLWIFLIIILLLAVIFFVYGFLTKPAKKAK